VAKKKRKKERTQNKFENAVIAGARTAFKRYSPKYGAVRDRARVEIPWHKKDGTLAQRPSVRFKCELCGRLTQDGSDDKNPDDPDRGNNVDHIDPVVEIGKSRKDYTLSEFIARLDCKIENLQLLCLPCHKEKTTQEKELRSQAK